MGRPLLGIALLLYLPTDRRAPAQSESLLPPRRDGWSRVPYSLPASSARWLAAEGG
jgi:hypothetical protein